MTSVIRMADRVRRRLSGLVFDAQLGTSTVEWKRGVPQELEYHPSDLRKIRMALRALRPGPDDVVIDYGAGLGRAVLAIARYTPVRRVIGIEYQAEIHNRAVKNVVAARSKLRCQDVRIEHADARTFEVPDDVTVVYLFNPFLEPTLWEVGNQVLASVKRVPRPLTVVYNYPPAWSRVWLDLGFDREVLHQHLHFYRWPTTPAL